MAEINPLVSSSGYIIRDVLSCEGAECVSCKGRECIFCYLSIGFMMIVALGPICEWVMWVIRSWTDSLPRQVSWAGSTLSILVFAALILIGLLPSTSNKFVLLCAEGRIIFANFLVAIMVIVVVLPIWSFCHDFIIDRDYIINLLGLGNERPHWMTSFWGSRTLLCVDL